MAKVAETGTDVVPLYCYIITKSKTIAPGYPHFICL
mgnify:CR=1 FL=1